MIIRLVTNGSAYGRNTGRFLMLLRMVMEVERAAS